MSKDLKNYAKWNKWFVSQEDKKMAYKVFCYWLKIKDVTKKLDVKFNKDPKELQENLKDQYVENKFLHVFGETLKEVNEIDIDSQKENIDKIKKKVGCLSYTAKDLKYMINQLAKNMSYSGSSLIKNVSREMDHINRFFKNSKKENLKTYLNSVKIDYKEFSNKKTDYIIVETSKEQLKMLASPSWCLLYGDCHIDNYYNKFKKIILGYTFDKKTKEFKMYGFNMKGFTFFDKEIEYPGEVINLYNEYDLNEDVVNISKEIAQKEDIENVFRKDLSLSQKIEIALLGGVSKEFLRGAIKSSITSAEIMNKVIDTLSKKINSILLKEFVKLVIKDEIYKKWIKNAINCIRIGGGINLREIDLVYQYVFFYNKDTSMINDFLKLEMKLLTKKQFMYMYKNYKNVVINKISTLFYLDYLDEKDFLYVSKKHNNSISLELAKELLEHSNTIEGKNEKISNFLIKNNPQEFIKVIKFKEYKKLSIKQRQNLLLQVSSINDNVIKLINKDFAIDKDLILKYLIVNKNMSAINYLKLNQKERNKYKQLYLKIHKARSFQKLNIDELNEVRGKTNVRFIDFLDLINLENKAIFNKIIEQEKDIKNVQKVIKRIKAFEMTVYHALLIEMSKYYEEDFSIFYKIMKDFEHPLLLIDVWHHSFRRFPIGAVLETFSQEDQISVLTTENIILNYLEKDTFKKILNQNNLLETNPEGYAEIIVFLENRKIVRRMSDIFCFMKEEFKKEYGIVKYSYYKMCAKIKRKGSK